MSKTRKGNVAFTAGTSRSLGLGNSKHLQLLGSLIFNGEIQERKDEEARKIKERRVKKEARCKLTDEQVRELRHAHEVLRMKTCDIYKEYGERYNITLSYLYSLLTYQTRSKIYV